VSWNSEAAPDLAGRTYPVTGGNAGVGEPVRVQQSKVDTAGAPGMISCQAARPQPSRHGRQCGLVALAPDDTADSAGEGDSDARIRC
jgi:hypothetical protein